MQRTVWLALLLFAVGCGSPSPSDSTDDAEPGPEAPNIEIPDQPSDPPGGDDGAAAVDDSPPTSSTPPEAEIVEQELGVAKELEGHARNVSRLAFSSDGKLLASGTSAASVDDESGVVIKVWNVETGEQTASLFDDGNTITELVFSPDGRRLIFGGYDPVVKVWDLSTGEGIQTFEGHGEAITALALSPDGKTVVSAADDGTVKFWELETAVEVRSIDGLEKGASAVVFSPEGESLALASGNTIKLYNASDGAELATLDGHDELVDSLAFTPDGKRLASASRDDTVRVWDVETGMEQKSFDLDTFKGISVAFAHNGRTLVAGNRTLFEGAIKAWDTETWKPVASGEVNSGEVRDVAVSPDDKYVASNKGNIVVLLELPPRK